MRLRIHIPFVFLLLILFTGAVPCSYVSSRDKPQKDIPDLICPGIYRIPGAAVSYLLKYGDSGILIDAGSENLSDILQTIGVKHIDWILHTHYHRDQCLSDTKFKKLGASIAAGNLEYERLGPRDMQPPYKVPSRILLNGEVAEWGGRMAPFQKTGVDRILKDNEVFIWNNYRIRIVSTPGHTLGSISYCLEINDKKLCFTGDLIIKGGYVRDLYSMEWNYLENPGIDSSLISLRKIADFNPDFILPSHGGVIKDPEGDIRLLTYRLENVRNLLHFERAGRWNWSGFVRISEHVIQDCGTTSQIIIGGNGDALLFDCGPDITTDRLKEAKRMFGFKRIDIIIPSHWHYDHVDGINSVAASEGSKIWVCKGLAEHLEFPERFPTTCWTGRKIKPDSVLSYDENFDWGGYSFKIYRNPAHMEEQIGLSSEIDGLKYYFIADGTSLNKESHVRSAIHGYNGISLENGLLETARSFYKADPYICVPAHSNGFATFDDTKSEFMDWAVRTTDAIKAMLLPAHPDFGFDPYWASFYPAKIKAEPGENVSVVLRLKNSGPTKISGSFRLKSFGNLILKYLSGEFTLEPGETTEFPFKVGIPRTSLTGIHIVTADIIVDNEIYAEFPEGFVDVERP